jgi:hypothetical protein
MFIAMAAPSGIVTIVTLALVPPGRFDLLRLCAGCPRRK